MAVVLAAEGDPDLRDRGGPREFVLEEAIVADFGLVRAWKGDRHGNLVYRDSARNFNPLAAMCGRVTIAEVEELVEPGELDPNHVHTPGVFVQRVVRADPGAGRRQADREASTRSGRHGQGDAEMSWTREQMAARAASELTDGSLREPRHRAADAGAQLRRRRRRAGAAVGERHPRRRRLPDRGRGGPRPDQRRQGDRHPAPGRVVLRLRDLVRDDPRRQDRRRDPRRDAGLGGTATSPTG